MRAVVQRVSEASVRTNGPELGRIGTGFLVLLGVANHDTELDARFLADRIIGLRVFADSAGKMNLDLQKANGALLVVSQFTLLADTSSGRRPSFTQAAEPEKARELYQQFISICREAGVKVEQGEFSASMQVSLINEGPVTIIIDSRSKM